MITFFISILKNWKIALAIAVVLTATLAVNRCSKAEERAAIAEQNQATLLQENKEYRTTAGKSAIEVEKLQLTVKEINKHRSYLQRTIADLNIRIKRVLSAETTSTETTIPIQAQIKDSIRYLAGKTDTLRCIDLNTTYYSLKGCERNGDFTGTMQSRDTLTQIAHRVPRKFLFIRWGTKGIRQEVTSANPYTKIIFSEYLEIRK